MMPELEAERVYEAIRQGVHDALWQMITNATSMPSADFYEAIKAGVVEALVRMEPSVTLEPGDVP